jgi:biotin-dependent carboxylase-like uncharacterized protein
MTALRVVRAGPRTTVQDLGRRGFAHLGVPVAGAADLRSCAAANAAVGNPPEAAVLESTLGGDVLEAAGDVVVAVVGAGSLRVERLEAGAQLRVGRATGAYAYVAVAGGFDVAAVLGSRSTDTLSGLGPPLVRAGILLPVLAPDRSAARDIGAAAAVESSPELTVPVWPGPHLDLLRPQLYDDLVAAQWTVTPMADRVALRLAGPDLRPGIDGIRSEGLVPGAIQVPPAGRPVVFLANHPPTGGYPVAAVVRHDALPAVAQARPGARLRLTAAQLSR